MVESESIGKTAIPAESYSAKRNSRHRRWRNQCHQSVTVAWRSQYIISLWRYSVGRREWRDQEAAAKLEHTSALAGASLRLNSASKCARNADALVPVRRLVRSGSSSGRARAATSVRRVFQIGTRRARRSVINQARAAC